MPAMSWFLSILVACASAQQGVSKDLTPAPLPTPGPGQAAAVFAGGCFWCMEKDFDHAPGVISTTSGFAGGTLANPTYEDVSRGATGHYEAVYVVYDTSKTTYSALLDYYWHHVDPTDGGGQFCDRGTEYRTAVLYLDVTQQQTAEASKTALNAANYLPGPVVTEIRPAGTFWPAETYHQDFYVKSPTRYNSYRTGCGRDARVAEVWKNAPK